MSFILKGAIRLFGSWRAILVVTVILAAVGGVIYLSQLSAAAEAAEAEIQSIRLERDAARIQRDAARDAAIDAQRRAREAAESRQAAELEYQDRLRSIEVARGECLDTGLPADLWEGQ